MITKLSHRLCMVIAVSFLVAGYSVAHAVPAQDTPARQQEGVKSQDNQNSRPRRANPPQSSNATVNPKPDNQPAEQGQVAENYKLGLESYKKAKYEDAVRYFKQAISLKPQRATLAVAHFYLGDSYSELGRHTEAVEAYTEALRLNPKDDVAFNNLGVAYNELGKYNAALEDYNQAIHLKSDIAMAHYNVGVAYYNLKQYPEAVEAYRRAIRLQPDSAGLVHYNLGLTFQNMDRYEDAVDSYKQAIRLSPDLAETYYNLGRVYNKIGNNGAALEQYNILKTLDPERAERLYVIVNPPKPIQPVKEKPAIVMAEPAIVRAEMVSIPGGTFQMGRSDVSAQNPADTNQFPAHAVTVPAFLMDKTEVTNAEYAEFIRDTKYSPPSHWTQGKPPAGQEQWPVTNVSFNDAEAFAAWRSKRDGVQYRLPSEEEWEYAARDGAANFLYPWGGQWREGMANVGTESPQPVGTLPEGASAWGVLDLIGNVWEWTASKNSVYPGSENNKEFEIKVTPEQQGWMVTRGNSYKDKVNGEGAITAARRKMAPPATKHETLGFRLVRSGS